MATGGYSKMLITCAALRLGKTSCWDIGEGAAMERGKKDHIIGFWGFFSSVTDLF